MPGAPRPDNKAKKIAFDILGTPPNMLSYNKRSKKERIEERLTYQNTLRER